MSVTYGSQHELLQWIHVRTDELNARVLAASDSLSRFATRIDWIGPSAAGAELRDSAWDEAGLAPPSPHASGWWPRGGPAWDGVARVQGAGGRRGALFVEAKGHRRELKGRGTRATGASRTAIASALHDVQNGLDVPPGTEWLGPVYQPANRLAWIWYAREHPAHAAQPVDAWLVSVYFAGGVYPWGVTSVDGPADEQAWRPLIDGLHKDMGLPPQPHALSDRVVELFLPVATAPA